jgi:hypothetical protein
VAGGTSMARHRMRYCDMNIAVVVSVKLFGDEAFAIKALMLRFDKRR